MILSSADILRVLGADAIIRQEASLSVVDGKSRLGVGDTVYIYIDKYPSVGVRGYLEDLGAGQQRNGQVRAGRDDRPAALV